MASRLESLPDELLDLIIDMAGPFLLNRIPSSQSEFGESIKTYAAISLTSRALSSIARPHLYRSIRTKDMGSRIQPLLRTLSRQPVLATHVEVLELHPPCNVSTPMSPDDLDQCWLMAEQMIGRNALPLKAMCTFAQTHGCRAWEMVILLALTTKLRMLAYEVEPASSDDPNACAHCPDMNQVLTTMFAGDLGSRYSQLAFVSARGSLARASHHTVLATILNLPTVTTLWAHHIGNDIETRLSCAPQTSNVRNLFLYPCHLDAERILQLLSACKALENVHIGLAPGAGDHRSYVHPRILLAALHRHDSSLQLLRMSDPFNCGHFWHYDDSAIFTAGLSRFQRLTTLCLDEAFLFSWEGRTQCQLEGEYSFALPPALEILVISSTRCLGALPTMISAVRPSLPRSVRYLEVHFEEYPEHSVPKCFNGFILERMGTLDWDICPALKRFPDKINENTFLCSAQDRPIDACLAEVVNLAGNGGGIDALLSHLYRLKHDKPGHSTPPRLCGKGAE